MDQTHARRIGAAAICCALVIRLFTSGAPQAVADWLTQPNIAAFLLYLETGRTVRFSSSQAVFAPNFAESPPPSVPEPTEAVLASFSEGEVEIFNTSKKEPETDELLTRPLQWDLRGEKPTVLILHTHATESYTRQAENYRESSDWRTLDEHYNMLSIGAYVAAMLEEAGIPVIQDRTLHDHPTYSGSYGNARETIRAALKENPDIKLILDLHRDALEGKNGQIGTRATVDGAPSAQLMLVVGANHKGYENNLSLALKLHTQLEYMAPGIMRPLQLRPARFNQDLHPAALLVEIGAAGNTHKEAIRAADQLAEAIIALADGTE